MAEVVAVNLGKRIALLDDGSVIPITDMLDADGDITDDPEDAVTAVAGADAEWLAFSLCDFEYREAH